MREDGHTAWCISRRFLQLLIPVYGVDRPPFGRPGSGMAVAQAAVHLERVVRVARKVPPQEQRVEPGILRECSRPEFPARVAPGVCQRPRPTEHLLFDRSPDPRRSGRTCMTTPSGSSSHANAHQPRRAPTGAPPNGGRRSDRGGAAQSTSPWMRVVLGRAVEAAWRGSRARARDPLAAEGPRRRVRAVVSEAASHPHASNHLRLLPQPCTPKCRRDLLQAKFREFVFQIASSGPSETNNSHTMGVIKRSPLLPSLTPFSVRHEPGSAPLVFTACAQRCDLRATGTIRSYSQTPSPCGNVQVSRLGVQAAMESGDDRSASCRLLCAPSVEPLDL
jgi:hypothetical protein